MTSHTGFLENTYLAAEGIMLDALMGTPKRYVLCVLAKLWPRGGALDTYCLSDMGPRRFLVTCLLEIADARGATTVAEILSIASTVLCDATAGAHRPTGDNGHRAVLVLSSANTPTLLLSRDCMLPAYGGTDGKG
jgi:hypothetical protein